MTTQTPTWLCGEELPDLSAAFTSALSENRSTPGLRDPLTREYLRSLKRFVWDDAIPLAQADDETITNYTSRLGGVARGNVSLDIDRNFRVQIRKQNSSCYRAATAGNIEQLKTELCALERLLDEGWRIDGKRRNKLSVGSGGDSTATASPDASESNQQRQDNGLFMKSLTVVTGFYNATADSSDADAAPAPGEEEGSARNLDDEEDDQKASRNVQIHSVLQFQADVLPGHTYRRFPHEY